MFPPPQPVFLDDFEDDAGMVTPELSVLIIVGVAFAAVLFTVIQSEPVMEALAALVQQALTAPN